MNRAVHGLRVGLYAPEAERLVHRDRPVVERGDREFEAFRVVPLPRELEARLDELRPSPRPVYSGCSRGRPRPFRPSGRTRRTRPAFRPRPRLRTCPTSSPDRGTRRSPRDPRRGRTVAFGRLSHGRAERPVRSSSSGPNATAETVRRIVVLAGDPLGGPPIHRHQLEAHTSRMQSARTTGAGRAGSVGRLRDRVAGARWSCNPKALLRWRV